MLTASSCNYHGGQAQGSGTHCEQSPCAPVPVDKKNWGRVKALYR